MEQVLFIVWRECVEALLVVGILYSWLKASPQGRRGLPYLWGGVAGGLALAGALALVLLGISEWLSDTGQEWFQGIMSLAACLLVVQMVLWMKSRGRTLKSELESGARTSIANDNWWGLFALVAISVAREGSETVVFLYGTVSAASAGNGSQSVARLLLGGVAGFAAAVLTFWLLQLGGKLITWRRFFKLTEILLLLLAGSLLVGGLDHLIPPRLGVKAVDDGTHHRLVQRLGNQPPRRVKPHPFRPIHHNHSRAKSLPCGEAFEPPIGALERTRTSTSLNTRT